MLDTRMACLTWVHKHVEKADSDPVRQICSNYPRSD